MKIIIFGLICGLFINALFMATSGHAQNRKYVVLGPGSCGIGNNNCHASDGKWWEEDDHYTTVDDIFDNSNSGTYADLYRIGAENFLKGEFRCAECHGTVRSGREKRDMDFGVSCESCHGPAGPEKTGYLDVHQEGDPAKDQDRSGYVKALQVGLVKLRDVNIRAKTCVRCHYITDQKLLNTGHPSGAGFNYGKGIEKNISKHWDYDPRPKDLDKEPYEKEKGRRGPIPKRKLTSDGRNILVDRPKPSTPTSKFKAPPAPPFLGKKIEFDLEPFPVTSDSTSVEEILMIVKRRIESIHKKIGSQK